MSRYPPGHPHQQAYSKPPIVVTDNDVLSGRGVNIAAHAGNERFRTLVTTRADDSYCETYSATEKKAVAEEIVRHIASLAPPGRFLKREGRGQVSRGLNGPWEELSRREAIKKTCQALRDCNRADRATYAHGVAAPTDVKAVAEELATSGLALRERATRAAAECAAEASARLRSAMEAAGVPEDSIEEQLRRQRADPTYVVPGFAVTSTGAFAPIAQPGYPAVMQVIGPDGIPVPTHDPVPTPGQMPGIYSMYPHPAVDAAPMNMEAHLAARVAAGYVHPDDRARIAAEVRQKQEAVEAVEAAAAAGVKEEAAAAEVAAAAVATLAGTAAAPGAEVAGAQDAVMAKTEAGESVPPPVVAKTEAGEPVPPPAGEGEGAADSGTGEEAAAAAAGETAAPSVAEEVVAAPEAAKEAAAEVADEEMADAPEVGDEVAVAPAEASAEATEEAAAAPEVEDEATAAPAEAGAEATEEAAAAPEVGDEATAAPAEVGAEATEEAAAAPGVGDEATAAPEAGEKAAATPGETEGHGTAVKEEEASAL